ncbi:MULTISPECIES: PDR/VanB family oxidoreductase [unclassified Rhodococcus (in: high G+C Gram-positive bacteria)]|uniref:PDR/VanB family oxidoreductase n=1 Tax=unclassified Rhodococcus (in: high G+C Gram-positive bacteria) TaxID=192944 RepID=UPI00096A7435|nr:MULTISPECIES: PDR/VanB family oxidoreductase [unclassified Rhodococcus (in: high G+C Gram-positive bacteria)]
MATAGNAETEISLTTRTRRLGADDVVVVELESADGQPLPEWEPGAHIDLCLPDGVTRQYSLCGDPADRTVYRVGVLRDPHGRGGSKYVFDNIRENDAVTVRGPRNHFPFLPSSRYIFIAGGIGITPILPMITAAMNAGAQWELHYGGRTRSSMSFVEELTSLPGNRVILYPQDEVGLIDLGKILDTPALGTLVYSCGPGPLLEAVEARASNWPINSVHVERFEPKVLETVAGDDSFEIELAESGMVLTVPSEKSVLQVLEEADVEVYSSCQDGTCGTCETPVISGEVNHRDSIMSPAEQAANDRMYVCVSRASCSRLVLGI